MARKFFSTIAAGAVFALAVAVACPAGAAQVTTTMQETVASTLAYNPTIKAFQEYRQAAEHDLARARSGWFPRVDARTGVGMEQWSDRTTRPGNSGVNRGFRGNSSRQNARDFYPRSEASLTISQTIWDGMDTWNRVLIGQGRLDSAESRLFDNAEGLGLDAVLAHIEIFRQRRIVALAELNVQNHRRILASQHQRYRSGASTMADVTQTQGRLARTEASLAESRAALDVAIANYKRLTGKDPGPVEAPAVPANAFPSLEAALAASQTANLKVKALQSDIKTAEAQVELDKAPFHPNIFIEAGPTYRYQVGSAGTDEGGTVIMLRANWNLYNGGYDWYNVQADKARTRQVRQELNSQLDLLAEEAEATWAQLISAQEQARHFADAVNFSTRTRNMYLEQFNVGQRSLLDVLDSENELFSSSIQLVTSQQNIIAAHYRLLALGGGFLANFGLDRGTLVVNTD